MTSRQQVPAIIEFFQKNDIDIDGITFDFECNSLRTQHKDTVALLIQSTVRAGTPAVTRAPARIGVVGDGSKGAMMVVPARAMRDAHHARRNRPIAVARYERYGHAFGAARAGSPEERAP